MYEINPQSNPASTNGSMRNDPQLLAAGIVNWSLTVQPYAWSPPTDVIETEDKFVIRVEIAGMRDGDFSVTIDGSVLTIHGVRSDTNERRAYHQMEIHYGEFTTDVELPGNTDVNQVVASYDDGFLWVQLPKVLPRHIPIGD
jgi:HSP20 family protein